LTLGSGVVVFGEDRVIVEGAGVEPCEERAATSRENFG
jgi:hypothetical protein